MLPSPSELQYFIEVAHAGNLTRAADRLGIRQSSVSQAIARLEATLGATLFLRGKSGVRLTRSGEGFLPKARALLTDWESLRTEVIGDETRVKGRFTLGCHTAVARYALPRFLPRLLRDHASLEIALRHDLSRKIADEVIHHRIDFGLVVNPWPHPEIVVRELLSDRVTLWTSVVQPRKAQSLPSTLLLDPELNQSQTLLKILKRRGIAFDRPITGGSLEVLAQMARAGVGAAILPERVALEAGGLSALKDMPEVKDRVCLVYRADSQRGVAGRTIARAIIDGLADR